jgi:heme exporter protein D
MNKVKTFFIWLARGLVGILLAVFTVLLVRERKANDFEMVAEDERQKAEDAVRATPAHSIAEHYDGVGDAIESGRNRFATRIKNRILAAGGRRINGERTD